jgi:hypothetical protein
LSPNFEKTHSIHFITKHIPAIHMKTGYGNKLIPNILHTKFPGIDLDSTLSWRTHIEQPVYKLSTAFYVIGSCKPYMPHTTLIMIYYSCFHSIMNYGLIFCGNSSYSSTTFGMLKGVVRIIVGCRSRDSCQNLFKKVKLLPVKSQYIFSLLLL